MNTCKTCCFYDAHYFRCTKGFVDVPNDVREFKSDTMRVHVWPGGNDKQYPDIVHNVFTGPDFGCIHWKGQDEPT